MVMMWGGGEGVVNLLSFEFQFLKIINFNFKNEIDSSLVLSNPNQNMWLTTSSPPINPN
jgi:hypothetical protein